MENKLQIIVQDLFHFSQFVAEAENDIPNQSALYSSIWWELETLNASALEYWEKSGKPLKWNMWQEKYQSDALQLVKQLLSEQIPENNIICDISHFLYFTEQAESEIPHQSFQYAEYWWELETFKVAVMEDWERLGRPINWEKWDASYKKEAFRLIKQLNSSKQ